MVNFSDPVIVEQDLGAHAFTTRLQGSENLMISLNSGTQGLLARHKRDLRVSLLCFVDIPLSRSSTPHFQLGIFDNS